MQIPLDSRIKELADIPYTISFIIRKRQQIDNLNELPKDKKVPEDMIWNGTPEDIEEWISNVFDSSGKKKNEIELRINPKDIEG